MNKLLNLVANGSLNDFKNRLKSALDTKFGMLRDEVKQEVGKSYSTTPSDE